MGFEGSEKCDRIASISHFIFLTEGGKMKNVRCLPLDLQVFCLMWLIISISDRNRVQTWKHGPRGGVLGRVQVGEGCATNTVIP